MAATARNTKLFSLFPVLAAIIGFLGLPPGQAQARKPKASSEPKCQVSSVKSERQSGGVTAGCVYMMQPPPEIAEALIGTWTGQSDCGPNRTMHLTWQVTRAENQTLKIGEVFNIDRPFRPTGSVSYDAEWHKPDLVLTSHMPRYSIMLRFDGKDELAGRYYDHINCTDVFMHKVSN